MGAHVVAASAELALVLADELPLPERDVGAARRTGSAREGRHDRTASVTVQPGLPSFGCHFTRATVATRNPSSRAAAFAWATASGASGAGLQ